MGGIMNQKGTLQKDYVKKETMLVVALVSLVAGFLGGVAFGVYRSGGSPLVHPIESSQQISNNQGLSADQKNRISSLEKETSLNPNSAEAWARLGDAYFDASVYQKAIDAYNKSLSLNPNNANVMTDLGIMYRRSGEPQKAVESFDKAISIDPRHEPSRFNKGVVLFHDLNDSKGAVAAWKQLVDLNPTAKSPSGMLVSELLKKVGPGGKR